MNSMTLTEISYYSRRSAPYVVVGILILLILFYSFKILFLIVDTRKVTPVESNPVFGAVPPPKVSGSVTPSGQLSYVLDTIEGSPVTATASAKVFFLPKKTTRFGFREKITLLAKSFGINTDTTKYSLNGMAATFRDSKNTFNIDIGSFNFDYAYALDSDPALFDNVRIPDENEVQTKASEFLRSIDAYPEGLAQGKVNVVYMHYDPATTALRVVDNPNDANMVEADFYRPDIDGFPVVSPKYFNSQNYIAMVFNDRNFKIVKAQLKYYEVSNEQVGLYPIKTGEQAYQMLQAGRAIFVSVPPSQDIVIKKMFMGYLDPDEEQDYLEPVYVFLGSNNFVAYVPAIAEEFLTQ